jgi:uncharacterized membrane protein
MVKPETGKGRMLSWAREITDSNFSPAAALTMLIFSLTGLFASFTLTVEKIKLVADPNYALGCDVNVVLSCGSLIIKPEASLFGFPNPLLGVAGFAILAFFYASLIARVRYPRWFYAMVALALTLAGLFMLFLVFTSLYIYGALCLWCMLVWLCVAFLWSVSVGVFAGGNIFSFSAGLVAKSIYSLRWITAVGVIAVVAALIFARWANFWLSLI